MCQLLLTNTDTDEDIASRSPSRGSLADDINEQDKAFIDPNGSKYTGLRFLLPTFNIFKRLLSSAEFALRDRRKGTLPSSIKVQLFLHVNCSFWGLSNLAELMP